MSTTLNRGNDARVWFGMASTVIIDANYVTIPDLTISDLTNIARVLLIALKHDPITAEREKDAIKAKSKNELILQAESGNI